MVGRKSGGAHSFSLEGIAVETQKVKIKYLRSNNNVKWDLIAVLEIGVIYVTSLLEQRCLLRGILVVISSLFLKLG